MKFFPPNIGLDISETSLKAVGLKESKNGLFCLESFGKDYFPTGTVSDGEIKSPSSFIDVLKSVLGKKENGFGNIKYLVVSLPEEKTFTRVLEIPSSLKEDELTKTLEREIESNFPVSISEVYYDNEILSEDTSYNRKNIMVSAAPKHTVSRFVSVLKDSGYEVLALEPESISIHRALFEKEAYKNETVLVLDIGVLKTHFMIVAGGVLFSASSNNVAGDRFSQALAEQFPISIKEAEFMKRTTGLDKNLQKGQEFLSALQPVLTSLKAQIQEYMNFFEANPAKNRYHENAQRISKIILTGGGARLCGLVDWLAQELSLPVVLGDSLIRVKGLQAKRKMSLEDSLVYTAAIGLALRCFEELKND